MVWKILGKMGAEENLDFGQKRYQTFWSVAGGPSKCLLVQLTILKCIWLGDTKTICIYRFMQNENSMCCDRCDYCNIIAI